MSPSAVDFFIHEKTVSLALLTGDWEPDETHVPARSKPLQNPWEAPLWLFLQPGLFINKTFAADKMFKTVFTDFKVFKIEINI